MMYMYMMSINNTYLTGTKSPTDNSKNKNGYQLAKYVTGTTYSTYSTLYSVLSKGVD